MFADGEGTPLAPAGNKVFSSSRNWSYTSLGESDGHAVPVREVAAGTPDINAFDLWTDRARYNPGENVWIQAARFADYPDRALSPGRGSYKRAPTRAGMVDVDAPGDRLPGLSRRRISY